MAAAYNNMAVASFHQSKYEEALWLFEKNLGILLSVHGADHPSVAGAYNGMANAYTAMGEYEEALEMHRKSLHIRVKEHGPDHPVNPKPQAPSPKPQTPNPQP